MEENISNILWKQFGGIIDMLENAIKASKTELWTSPHNFWYITYHTLFYLDYYLDEDPDNYHPPPPFDLSEFDPEGRLPDRIYSKIELLDYLEFCRKKCFYFVGKLDENTMKYRWVNPYRDYSYFEMVIYNMRHVQHHTGQLNLLIRQVQDEGAGWVSRTDKHY